MQKLNSELWQRGVCAADFHLVYCTDGALTGRRFF